MIKCHQCGKDMKSIGGVENMHSVVSLFVCFKPECPNFGLAQVGLSEIKDD